MSPCDRAYFYFILYFQIIMTLMTEVEINEELDEMALEFLLLNQTLIDTKLMLEHLMKEGYMGLAQSRYTMGRSSSISCLQLPNEEWEPFDANLRVKRSECLRPEINVKFNYLSLDYDADPDDVVENLDSQLVNRKKSKNEKESTKTSVGKKDPLKWFGVLLPNTLKQSQKNFTRAIELTVEASNIQNEVGAMMARRQFLMRNLKKIKSVTSDASSSKQ